MPPVLNYPGVYIEELQSGVHTITGVATSIAAFVGWAPQGPTDRAVLVFSFTEFQRVFGGLSADSFLGYSVNHFFANGGQQAYIVRLVDAATALTAESATAGGTLDLFASNPGEWGKSLRVAIQVTGTRFSIVVKLASASGQTQVVETFNNLSVTPTDPRYVVNVIDNDSQYITFVDPASPGTPIAPPGMPSTTASDATFSSAANANGTVLTPGTAGFHTSLDATAALGSSPPGSATAGLPLLNRVDIFNILCVPGETDVATITTLEQYCFEHRAMFIVDCPQTATTSSLNTNGPQGTTGGALANLGGGGHTENAAYYFPWVQAPDPLFGGRPALFPPCGFVAGIYASTDTERGVWKAPAGIDAGLAGLYGLDHVLTDPENGILNVQGINCLRQFKIFGNVVWGARTLQGADAFASQWKYVPIRRTAMFIESSLYQGTQWVVFEPNDETLWGQIRLNVGAFMQGLFLQGAFQGTTPQQAYFVKCDSENNPQASINQGIVNILVGFAPLYPAEFVVIQIQQMAGQ